MFLCAYVRQFHHLSPPWPHETTAISTQRKSLSSHSFLSSALLPSSSSSRSPGKPPPIPHTPTKPSAFHTPGAPTRMRPRTGPATTRTGRGSATPTRRVRGTTARARRYSRAGIASPITNPTVASSLRGGGSPGAVISRRSIRFRLWRSTGTPASVLSL